jgi:hypothetical protein
MTLWACNIYDFNRAALSISNIHSGFQSTANASQKGAVSRLRFVGNYPPCFEQSMDLGQDLIALWKNVLLDFDPLTAIIYYFLR